MRAILLAAGVGQRLEGFVDEDGVPLPKCLLRFGGRTLLDRHVEAMAACGVTHLDVVVGYRKEDVEAELARVTDAASGITGATIENPEYRRGSIISLQSAHEVFSAFDSLIMDADVLYPHDLLRRLIDSPHSNCLLLDARAEPDDEAMRVGADEVGRVHTIQRGLRSNYATIGESVGFFKLSPAAGTTLAAALGNRIGLGQLDNDYESGIDDMFKIVQMGFEPVAPFAWTEIDFADDVARATGEILPKLG